MTAIPTPGEKEEKKLAKVGNRDLLPGQSPHMKNSIPIVFLLKQCMYLFDEGIAARDISECSTHIICFTMLCPHVSESTWKEMLPLTQPWLLHNVRTKGLQSQIFK